MGDALTYKAHRLLLPSSSVAREYDHREICSMPAIGNTNPADSRQPTYNPERGVIYERLQGGQFA
jgi:hypothetical protein